MKDLGTAGDSNVAAVRYLLVWVPKGKEKRMISINYKDPRPVYEQIKDGFKKLILAGIMENGEKMPSVRIMAMDLAINPNTIQRAYRELEQEGFIYSVAGKGSFVGDVNELTDKHVVEMLEKLEKLVEEMKQSGVSRDRILEMVDSVYMD